MKLNEILNEGQDVSKLKTEIEQGLSPAIYDARGSRDHYAWGDLESLGWGVKHRQRSGRTTMEEYWEYTGPNTITRLQHNGMTSQMSAGDVTDTMEVDYD